jgi:hypothetical protein
VLLKDLQLGLDLQVPDIFSLEQIGHIFTNIVAVVANLLLGCGQPPYFR